MMVIERNQQEDIVIDDKLYPIQIAEDAVSPLHRCKSTNANRLCVFDIDKKLGVNGHYDIGGTYDLSDAPEMWFYFTSTTLPGYNYLMNLFLCHRKTGNISLNIHDITYEKEDEGLVSVLDLKNCAEMFTFKNLQPDQHFFIKTFCFSSDDIEKIKGCTLYIRLNFVVTPKPVLNKSYLNEINLYHCTLNIFKEEKNDFVLVSNDGKELPVHKMVLAAHSPILRNKIRNSTADSITVDVNSGVIESVLQFLYTGTVEDISKKDCMKICEAAEKLQIKNLVHLCKVTMPQLAGGV